MADHRLEIILAAKDITGAAFKSFQGKITAIGKSVFSLNAVVGTLAGSAGLGLLVTRSLDTADAIGKTADKLGIGTSALQEYRYAAELSGVAQGTLDMALQRVTRRIGEAAQGHGELKDTLAQYNIAVKDAAGNTRRTEDVLDDLADVIAHTASGGERLRIAFKAFDSEGAALVNMLKGGSAGLDEFRNKANHLGLIIRDDLIRNAETANDNLSTLGKVLKTQVTATVVSLAPYITKVSGGMLEWVQNNQQFIQQDFPSHLSDIAESVADIAGNLGTIAQYAGLRSVYKTYMEGIELSQKGLIDYNEFVIASFVERQKMVDAAINQTERFNVVTKKLDDSVPGFRAYVEGFNNLPAAVEKSTAAVNKHLEAIRGIDYSFLSRTDTAYRMSRAGGVYDAGGSLEAMDQAAYETGQRLGAAAGPDSWMVNHERHLESVQKASEEATKNITVAWEAMATNSANAVADFVTTLKFDFADLSQAIISDIVRIQSQKLFTGMLDGSGGGWLSGLGSWLSGLGVGSSSGATNLSTARWSPRANGGPVTAGQPYLVGERGMPELFIPGQSGRVEPIRGGGIENKTVIYNFSGMEATEKHRPNPTGGRDNFVMIGNGLHSSGWMDKYMRTRYGITPMGKLS